jgi:2-polyprenyl-6-hydroxyphenyl methylase/3-demethylubiquinone-9 3-methyltransferase
MSVEDFLAQHQTNINNNNNHNNDCSDIDSPYFDVICLLEVIEHVQESALPSLLVATSKLLHPTRGLLFVSTMSPTPQAYALTILAAEYIMRYLPIGTHDFNLYRSPDQVRQVMAGAGTTNLEQVNVTGMILAGPPPIMGMGSWNWKLDPSNTQVNWIGTYRKQSESNE